MRHAFHTLPGQERLPARPVVPVYVDGFRGGPLVSLIDTGSLRSRFGLWVAERAGIDLSMAPIERFALGGITGDGWATRVPMRVGSLAIEAGVVFCDPWPLSFQILGQEDFLCHARITISADQGWFDLFQEPDTEFP